MTAGIVATDSNGATDKSGREKKAPVSPLAELDWRTPTPVRSTLQLRVVAIFMREALLSSR